MAKQSAAEDPKTEELLDKIEELENKWKRALADYKNLEKRVAMERGQFVKLANVGLLDKFLSVLDDLERASEHIGDEGLEMILKQFYSILKSEGVEEVETQGAAFDPNEMDCVDMTTGEKNKVMGVLQKGFKIDSTVIRPAKVQVGDGSEEEHTNKKIKE